MPATITFTAAVDHDLFKRAEVIAAQSGSSVNALFNAQLRYLVETFESAEAGRNANYPTLLATGRHRSTPAGTVAGTGCRAADHTFVKP